jgi:hypothetical protein
MYRLRFPDRCYAWVLVHFSKFDDALPYFPGLSKHKGNKMKNPSIRLAIFSFLAAVLVLGGCHRPGPGKTDPDYANAIITMDRSVCFGRCPSYSLTIEGSGKVTYVGREFVGIKGTRTSEISKESFKTLADEFLRIDYFSLKDEYDSDISDVPETITSWKIDNKYKKIRNRFNGPKELTELQRKIDEVVNSKQWIEGAEEK